MRGNPHLNGHAAPSNGSSTKVGRPGTRENEEIVRLMIQALGDMGYTNAVQSLSQESGVKIESALVEEFRHAILNGDWSSAETALSQLELTNPDNKSQVLFLLREQKFLESLEQSSHSTALITLRTELSPLNHNIDRLHFLSGLIMTNSPEDLKVRAQWSGSLGGSRLSLLRTISSFISPNSMLPEARLTTLLESARQIQEEKCLYHTSSTPISYLIPEHSCPRSVFPLYTSHVLREHSDEVWHVQYSCNGHYLASIGADGLIVIYDASTMRPIHQLNRRTPEEIRRDEKAGLRRGVTYMSFSPDESTLMTCSQDNVIVHWDVATGHTLNQISQTHGKEPVTSASWLPDPDTGFVSGGMDNKINLYDDKGGIIYTWATSRISDFKITNDGKYIVAIGTDCGVYIYDINTKARIASMVLDFALTSVSLSNDSKRMLLSCSPKPPKGRSSAAQKPQAMEVQEWSIPDLQLLRQCKGQKQGEFVIRSCYAGYAEQFIMSGSEDSDVYLWHRLSGTLLERISGHTRSVGAVSWNPAADQWASASDDKTVRIWSVASGTDQETDDLSASQGANGHNGFLASPLAQTSSQYRAQ